MRDISAEALTTLTINAQEWAYYFQGVGDSRDFQAELALALSRCFVKLLRALTDSLQEAISSSVEFSRDKLRDPLIRTFSNPDIVSVTRQGEVDFNIEKYAGSAADFQAGVDGARALLGVNMKRSPAQRAVFWRTMVWPSNELWSDTIEARNLAGWDNKAPYWFILEHGNRGLAYPPQRATNFIYKAKIKAQGIFDQELQAVQQEAQNIVLNAVEDYLRYPDTYTQYDILSQFFAKGSSYYVYITATRQVGVALPSTYEQLRREYSR